MRQGELEQAAKVYEENLGRLRQLGDAWTISWALGGRGEVARLQGDYELAGSLLRESLAMILERGYPVEIAFTLEALGHLAADQGRPARAARLWGAADALRDEVHSPLSPTYQRDYRPYFDEARAELGQATFEAAWAKGRAMTTEEAIAYVQSGD
jgi:tetratricopeptide (TPR) repeat protein